MTQLQIGDPIPVGIVRSPRIDRLRKELEEQREEEDRLEGRILQAQDDLSDVQDEIERLEKEIESLQTGEDAAQQFPIPPYGETLVPSYPGFWEGVVNA